MSDEPQMFSVTICELSLEPVGIERPIIRAKMSEGPEQLVTMRVVTRVSALLSLKIGLSWKTGLTTTLYSVFLFVDTW